MEYSVCKAARYWGQYMRTWTGFFSPAQVHSPGGRIWVGQEWRACWKSQPGWGPSYSCHSGGTLGWYNSAPLRLPSCSSGSDSEGSLTLRRGAPPRCGWTCCCDPWGVGWWTRRPSTASCCSPAAVWCPPPYPACPTGSWWIPGGHLHWASATPRHLRGESRNSQN